MGTHHVEMRQRTSETRSLVSFGLAAVESRRADEPARAPQVGTVTPIRAGHDREARVGAALTRSGELARAATSASSRRELARMLADTRRPVQPLGVLLARPLVWDFNRSPIYNPRQARELPRELARVRAALSRDRETMGPG